VMIMDKTLDLILKNGYIDVPFTDYSNNLIHFGWESEEWVAVYYENVTIGICDSGVWSQYNNCTPSGNWTTTEKQVYANVTFNETLWKINGTTPDYKLLQIWTDIHENSYDISMSLFSSYNYSTINLVSYPLEANIIPNLTIDFEDGTDGNMPVDWTPTGTSYLTLVSDDIVKNGNKSFLIQNSLTNDRPSISYTTLHNYTADSSWIFNIYLDKLGVVEPSLSIDDGIQGNILTYNIDTSTHFLKWYNQSSASWISGTTDLTLNTWHTIHTNFNFGTDTYEIYVDDSYEGKGYFRNHDHNADSVNRMQWLFNENANETHIYTDDYFFYSSSYTPAHLGSTANQNYEVLWTTGWAYCTDHANCTDAYYCSLTGDENSKCTLDNEATLELYNLQSMYSEGETTFFASYTYDDLPIENATVRFELYNASINGTLLGNTSASYSNGLYYVAFNVTEFDDYYIEVYAVNQPLYSSEIDTGSFDVVLADLITEYPLITSSISSRTLYPQFRIIMSDFVQTATCRYKTALQDSNSFTVSNNVTYVGTSINPVNGENYLIVICNVGEIELSESVTFSATVIPDVYTLGMTWEVTEISRLTTFYFKEFLWTFGKPFMAFTLMIGTIVLIFNNLFIRVLNYIKGR